MKNIFSVAVMLMFVICSYAQTTDAIIKHIDSIFNSAKTKKSRGGAITIIEDGKVLVKKAYGLASFEHQLPFTHESVVKMGYSEGREFLSIAAVLMEKDGILKLDDKVRKYFPKLPAWSDPVSIWNLMDHSSGFADEWAEFSLIHGSVAHRIDVSQFLNLLYKQPKSYVEPGKGYMYSNSDYGLLRLILEKASGKNLSAWLKQRIFGPLGMGSTQMQNDPEEPVLNKADIFWKMTDKISPGANYFIITNADDLEKWLAVHNDPASEISQAYVKLLSRNRMLPSGKQYPVGYSVKKIQGHEVIFHQGIHRESYLVRIPGKKFAMIAVGRIYTRLPEILNKYLGVQEPAPFEFTSKPIARTRPELQKFEGRYLWKDDAIYESYLNPRRFSDLFLQDSVLMLKYNASLTVPLIPVGKNKFYHHAREAGIEVQLDFEENPGKPMMALLVMSDGYKEKMERDPAPIWKPTANELTAFTGKFYSSHLDYYWTLELNEKGNLVIKRPTIADTEIEPDGLDQFKFLIEYYPGNGYEGWILFHKDEKNNITHFTVWHSRIIHHRFDKIKY